MKPSRVLQKRKRSSNASPVGCLAIFAILWLGIVFSFDGFILKKMYDLIDARQRYVDVPGVVTESRVSSRSDSDGTTYRPHIEFVYQVEGAEYTGDRYSVFQFGTSGSKYAHGVVRRYPVGKGITVHYDPDDPGQSALDLSDASVPYAILLFLLPFHCVGFGLFGSGLRAAWRWVRFRDERAIVPLIVRSNKEKIVLRDSYWSGSSVFFVVSGVSSFVLIFVVAFGYDFTLPRQAALWLFALCVGAGMLAATLARILQRRKGTLTIDRLAGRFDRSDGSRGVSFGEIETVRLTTLSTSTRVNDQPWYRHELSAIDTGGTEHRLVVVKGYKRAGEDARDWFAELLQAHADGEVPDEESGPSMPVVSEVDINRTKT